jgi:hypothetical protein
MRTVGASEHGTALGLPSDPPPTCPRTGSRTGSTIR